VVGIAAGIARASPFVPSPEQNRATPSPALMNSKKEDQRD